MTTAFSCDDESISFDATTKYRVYGKVTDVNGNPLDEIPVEFVVWNQYYAAQTQCMTTGINGEFDFVTSDPKTEGNLLRVNRDNYAISGLCMFSTNSDLEYAYHIFNDSLFSEYELEVDFTLGDAVELHIANNDEDGSGYYLNDGRLRYYIDHSGVDIQNELIFPYWEEIRFGDTLIHNIAPNQEVKVTFYGDQRDTVIQIGTEPYLLELK